MTQAAHASRSAAGAAVADRHRAAFAGARTLAASHDAIALAGVAVLALVMAVVTWRTWGDLGADTGYDTVAFGLVADGAFPYLDFVYYYGVLAPLLGGGVAWVAGAGLGSSIALGLVLTLTILAATYVAARTQSGPLGAALATAIVVPVAFAPTNLSFVVPHAVSAPLAILAALGAVLAVAAVATRPTAFRYVAVGLAVGVCALTRPEFAAGAGVGVALWLVLRRRARRSTGREIALVALPAVLMPLVVYAPFAVAVGPSELVWENLVPRDVIAGGPAEVLRTHAPMSLGSFVELGTRLALYGLGAAALVVAGRLLVRRVAVRRLLWVGLAGGVVAGAGAIALRPELVRHALQFAYGWIPAGAVVAVFLLVVMRRGLGSVRDEAALVTATILAVLGAKTYAAFFVHSPEPQYAVYALPFAAILLARLHLHELARSPGAAALGAAWLAFLATVGFGLTVKDARAETALVRGPGGAIAELPAEGRVYSAALDWIARETVPGESILLAPQMTTLYALSERHDPLRELTLHPGALPAEADERAAIRRLDEQRVRLALTDRRPYTEFGHAQFGRSFDRLLAGWIRRNFNLVATLRAEGPGSRTIDVWTRR